MKKEEYLNTQEAGLFIGKKSASAVRNLVMRRVIPYRKVGGRLIFIRTELERWINDSPGIHLEDLK